MEHILRHKLLKNGSRILEVYRHIKNNPGITTRVLRQIYPSSGYMSKLEDAGLIVGQDAGPLGKRWYAFEPNETGAGRTKITVSVEVFINDLGEYSIKARLLDQVSTAEEFDPRPIMTREFSFSVPKSTDPLLVLQQRKSDDHLIMDVDYEILPSDK